jgi:tRNA nucleotidyltransferase (CCA-adding enzyme)
LPWLSNAKLSVIANRLKDVPALAIYANCLASQDEKVCEILQVYLTRLSKITPTITGHDLQNRGLPPGPAYRRILGAIRDAWLDGKINNPEQEQAYLEELIKNEPRTRPPS